MAIVEIESAAPHVSVIRLNRPQRLNAINFPLVADLHDALDTVAADVACKVAILTGTGRAFCSGLDLSEYGELPKPGSHPHFPRGTTGQAFMSRLVSHMRRSPQVIIAAVNGPAFGGGLGLACGTDVRISAASARYCAAYIRTGLTGTDIGISYTLPRLIGASHAFDLILSGREIDAAEAHRIGLVSQVVDDAAFFDAVIDYAKVIAGYTHAGLTMTKEVLWHNLDAQSMDAALTMEDRNQQIGSLLPEVKDHMRAYSERITRKAR